VVANGGPARRAHAAEKPVKAAGRPLKPAGKVSEGPVSKAPAPRARLHPDAPQQAKGISKDARRAPPRSAEKDGGVGGGGDVADERVVAGSWDWERYVDEQIKLLPSRGAGPPRLPRPPPIPTQLSAAVRLTLSRFPVHSPSGVVHDPKP
jgi:hypothetical protein